VCQRNVSKSIYGRLEERLSLLERLGRATFTFREMFLGRPLKKRLTLGEDLANTKII
jgi:hypothetical protein